MTEETYKIMMLEKHPLVHIVWQTGYFLSTEYLLGSRERKLHLLLKDGSRHAFTYDASGGKALQDAENFLNTLTHE